MNPFLCLLYSLRNLILFRDFRDNPARTHRFVERLEALRGGASVQDMKGLMTDFMLSGVGLKTVNSACDQIPRGVWLTARQRKCISMVRECGYKAGLL